MGGLFNCKKSEDPNKSSGALYSQLYYQNTSSNNIHEDLSSPKEKINLIISLANVQNASYTVNAIISDDNFKTSKTLGRTNTKFGEDITFDTTFILDYYFEKKQKIQFDILILSNNTTEEIHLDTTVASIMGAKQQTLKLVFKEKSTLIVKGSTIKNNNINLKLGLLANTHGINNCAPFYIIKRQVNIGNRITDLERDLKLTSNPNQENIDKFQIDKSKTWIALYKSEVSKEKDFEFTKFKDVVIPVSIITSEEFYQNSELLIELHDNYNQKSLGSCIVTIDQLKTKNYSFLIKSNNNYGDIIVKSNCIIERVYRFLDYLRGGLQIALIVGIDFTGSNGDPNMPNSLHYISNKQENFYEKAIKSCASIVAYYDSDQLFPVFGYGGILPRENNVNHCFNVNLLPDPNVQFVDGIINVYRQAIKVVKLYGPTNFAPIIEKAIELSNEEKGNYIYHILMILTDGQISDINDTIDALVIASFLPISVIIIGVGTADFSSMDILDADTEPLISSKKVKAQRDLVQFVPFYKFQNNEKLLAEEVLAEIPFQVEEYYRLNNMPPRDPIIDNY